MPTAWYLTNKWIQNFAYPSDNFWWIFIMAALIALFVALLTLSGQTIKAARPILLIVLDVSKILTACCEEQIT